MKYSYNYIMSVSIPVMRLTQSAPIVRVPVEKYLYVQEIAVILSGQSLNWSAITSWNTLPQEVHLYIFPYQTGSGMHDFNLQV